MNLKYQGSSICYVNGFTTKRMRKKIIIKLQGKKNKRKGINKTVGKINSATLKWSWRLPLQRNCLARRTPQTSGMLQRDKITCGLGLKQHYAPKNCLQKSQSRCYDYGTEFKTLYRISGSMLAYLYGQKRLLQMLLFSFPFS